MGPKTGTERHESTDYPFPRCWWIEHPVLLAGGYPGDLNPDTARLKLRALLDVGIRTVVCLQPREETNADGEPFAPYEPLLQQLTAAGSTAISCVRHPITDCGAPTPSEMVVILDAIDASVTTARPVYLHCWGGHGRTGTVAGCWLVRQGYSGSEALARLTSLRGHDRHLRENPAPQTDAQRQMVRDWAGLDPAVGRRRRLDMGRQR
jgi:hypothetical protein